MAYYFIFISPYPLLQMVAFEFFSRSNDGFFCLTLFIGQRISFLLFSLHVNCEKCQRFPFVESEEIPSSPYTNFFLVFKLIITYASNILVPISWIVSNEIKYCFINSNWSINLRNLKFITTRQLVETQCHFNAIEIIEY